LDTRDVMKKAIRTVLLGAFILLMSKSAYADDDQQVIQARQTMAQQWFDPRTHLHLAKLLRNQGKSLEAFYICEDARRTFGDPSFNAAFIEVFGGVDSSEIGRSKLTELYKREPTVTNAMRCADAALNGNDLKAAESFAREAMVMAPDDFSVVASLASLIKKDDQRAGEADAVIQGFYRDHPMHIATLRNEISQAVEHDRSQVPALVQAALIQSPQDPFLLRMQGAVHFERGELDAADAAFERAADLGKESEDIQGATASYFLRGRKAPERALPFYLNCYFISPHYYDGKYAESRIRSITYGRGGAAFSRLVSEPGKKDEIVATEKLILAFNDADPVVLGMALDMAKRNWNDAFRPEIVRLLAHDDPNLRAMAMETLRVNPGSDPQGEAETLMVNGDLRVRGMALYLVAFRNPTGSVERLTALLTDASDLIRYDAASSLLMYCGEAGKAAIAANLGQEKNEWWGKSLKRFAERP
jgi:tetratricopeptide (TPR) repeat protein